MSKLERKNSTVGMGGQQGGGGGGEGGKGGKAADVVDENNPNAMIDRYLKSHNPNVGSTPVYFDYKKDARTFKLYSSIDHTATHLAFEGNLIRADTEEANKLEQDRKRREKEMELAEEAERNPDLVEQGVSTKILKNQFNYCDRASQTINPPRRERVVLTDPPPSIPYPNTVSQQIIFDAYEEERIANERAAAGKHQAAQAAARRGKGPAGSKGAGGAGGDAGGDSKGNEAGGSNQDIQSSPAYLHSLKILERMVNQNDSHDVIDDFKYWEDQSDQYKEDGNLLPLWRFMSDKVKRKEVTCIAWNPKYTDLFAVGYGSYEFLKQGSGAVLCFTLKNAFPSPSSGPTFPAHPEFAMHLESGVMAIDFHPHQPALLACGLYDGSVCVFDLRQRGPDATLKPQFHSTVRTGKHTDPVWDVRWSRDPNGPLQFFSISSDGRVTAWHLSKNELQFSDIMQLTIAGAGGNDDSNGGNEGGDNKNSNNAAGVNNKNSTSNPNATNPDGTLVDPEAALLNVSGGTCFDFSWESENIFVIGTEDGFVRRCSKAYNAQYLDAYEGHHMAVYTVRWNYYHPGVFLSCSADWTVKLWEKSSSRPLLTFDLANSVGDVAWAPYSSTVFAAVTSDGKVHVFDLNKNKNEPLCAQQVVKGAKLNRIAFNPKEPIILVGDTRGSILSLKLSPNLRKKPELKKGQSDDPASLRQLEVDKLDRLIEITLKDRELLDR